MRWPRQDDCVSRLARSITYLDDCASRERNVVLKELYADFRDELPQG